MSGQTPMGFETPERAHLAAAVARYTRARDDAEAAARRVRVALAAVAVAEGGEAADPMHWGAMLLDCAAQDGPQRKSAPA